MHTLLKTFTITRNLSLLYYNRIDKEKVYQQLIINDKQLNSAAWIFAHLTWAEYFLIHQGFGFNTVAPDWLDLVKIGNSHDLIKELPSIDIIEQYNRELHQATTEQLQNITDDILLQEALIPLKFGEDNSKQMMLMHTIRHEGVHAGQLSYLAKLL